MSLPQPALRARQVDVVVSAGWGKLMTGTLFTAFPNGILNAHPALLPSFPGPGRRAVRETIEWGAKVSGSTIHFLDQETDHGPIVFQEAVPVEEGDSVDSLHDRIKAVEHRLLPDAVRLQVLGKLHLDGRRVRIDSTP